MTDNARILCIGAMLWDVIGRSELRHDLGGDHAGSIMQRPGGVALNVALALAFHGLKPAILSAVGRDAAGEVLVGEAERLGVDCSWLYRGTGPGTDMYMAIEDRDQLVAAIADARALETAGDGILAALRDGRLGAPNAPWQGTIILDSNPAETVLAQFVSDPALSAADLRLVPASPSKVARMVPLLARPRTTFYLNRAEAESLAGTPSRTATEAAESVVARGARRVIVTDGPRTAAEAMRDAPTLSVTPPQVEVRRLTGAGDWFLAAHYQSEATGLSREEALSRAVGAAADYVSGKDPQ